MKTLSIILTALLFFIFGRLFQQATQLYGGYASLKAFGVTVEQVNAWERPFIILSVIYFIAFAFSLFFNIKKKYITNSVISGVMIMTYFFIIIFYKF